MKLFDKNFLDETERFNNHLLNKKEDVQRLISIAADSRKDKEFNELIFTAKYLKGLLRVVNKAPAIPEVESIEHIKTDISDNIKKIIDLLRNMLAGAESSTKNFFEENYLRPDQNNLANLNLLIADLESVKRYLNHLKHSN